MAQLPRGAGKLYVAMIAVLAVVVWITAKYEAQSAHFYGIAETKETVINTEAAVEIKQVAVVEGQAVDRGQLLVQLNSPEMTLEINQLTHQIEELKAAKGASKADLRARIAELRAERASKVAEIRSQINQLENQYNINRNLASGLQSLGPATKGAGTQNPLTLRVAALKRELAFALQPINIKIKALRQQIDAPTSAAKIQVQRLEQQLRLLRAENSKLQIAAQIAGVIGSVNFKAGEKVAPFAPILTLHAKTPSFIKGYIHEQMHASVALGDKVKVFSLAAGGVVNSARPSFVGEVVGVGSRIVAYPQRLSKVPDIQLWGREILVQIPRQNDLILGEKVMIETGTASGLMDRVFSSNTTRSQRRTTRDLPAPSGRHTADAKEAREIRVLEHPMEASAVHYLPDLERYLLLSDDTPHHRPLVFLMDRGGAITDEVAVEGIDKVRDLEAVAADGRGRLYLACSQNQLSRRRGKPKRTNRLLLRVTRRGKRFVLDRSVDLHDLLAAAATRDADAPWARFIRGSKEVDIEGLAYVEGSLLLGYKAPLWEHRSVILRLGEIDAVFEAQKIPTGAVSLFKRLQLQPEGRAQERLTGLVQLGGRLFITSTAKGGGGSLWRVDKTGEQPELIRSFARWKPEGIGLSAEPDQLIVTFDQGGKAASRFTVLEVVR